MRSESRAPSTPESIWLLTLTESEALLVGEPSLTSDSEMKATSPSNSQRALGLNRARMGFRLAPGTDPVRWQSISSRTFRGSCRSPKTRRESCGASAWVRVQSKAKANPAAVCRLAGGTHPTPLGVRKEIAFHAFLRCQESMRNVVSESLGHLLTVDQATMP